MWQSFLQVIGPEWLPLLIGLTALILGLFIGLLRQNRQAVDRELARLDQVVQQLKDLPGCQMGNRGPAADALNGLANPDLAAVVAQWLADSDAIHAGIWMPDPAPYLTFQMLVAKPARQALHRDRERWIFWTGLAMVGLILLVTASVYPAALANTLVRLFILLPLVITGGCLLFALARHDRHQRLLTAAWQSLLLHLQRKLPMFSQAAETAAVLTRYQQYDAQMVQSVKILAEQVQALASQQLTTAVAQAVRQTMSETIAPPIERSSAVLGELASGLAARLQTSENQLASLYQTLAQQQQDQAEQWQHSYATTGRQLVAQQGEVLQRLAEASQNTWTDLQTEVADLTTRLSELMQTLTANQTATHTTIATGQRQLQADLLADQQSALQAISLASLTTHSALREQIETTLHDLVDQQQQLASHLSDTLQQSATRQIEALQQQAASQTMVQQQLTASSQAAWNDLQSRLIAQTSQLSGLLQTISTVQSETHAAISSGQQRLQADLLTDQQAALAAINQTSQAAQAAFLAQAETALQRLISQQQQLTSQLSEVNQANLTAQGHFIEQHDRTLQDIAGQQKQLAEALLATQRQLVETANSQRQALAEALLATQQQLAERTASQHRQLTEQMLNTQQTLLGQAASEQRASLATALTALQARSDDGVRQLLSVFSQDVAGAVAASLEPITRRLHESADVLLSARSYANDVAATLALHKEQSQVMEQSIREVLASLLQAREAMVADLGSLERSTRTISESTASMSAVYVGSQSGLAGTIDRMTQEMASLSGSLQGILTDYASRADTLQSQSKETIDINRQHLDIVRQQLENLSNDLSTRIETLLLGFGNLTKDLLENVDSTINNQNNSLSASLRNLTEAMSNEARGMSLYAQEIQSDIEQLKDSMSTSVSEFNTEIGHGLNNALAQLDNQIAEILSRIAITAVELTDAVENLPLALQAARPEGV